MKYIVFSPYWNVPTSIIQKETTGYSQDPNYLSTHNMEWNEGRVRQNLVSKLLRIVKFLFPNSNAIYLHDHQKYLV
jgi:murein L,D-transpeptidase YcbB/YkuD